MTKDKIKLHSTVCEACIFGTVTDIEYWDSYNIDYFKFLWCEKRCSLKKQNDKCCYFIPKRKYRGKVHFY